MLERIQSENTVSGAIKIACTAADNVNVAFYQNAVPIIRDLAVENALGSDLTGVAVHLTSEPPFLTPGFGASIVLLTKLSIIFAVLI